MVFGYSFNNKEVRELDFKSLYFKKLEWETDKSLIIHIYKYFTNFPYWMIGADYDFGKNTTLQGLIEKEGFLAIMEILN